MKTGKQIGIKVSRAEIRKRKIILVLEPDLLSNESFALLNTWTLDRKRGELGEVTFGIQLKEKDGHLSIVSAGYTGSQYTKDHSQISSIEAYFLEDKDAALNWMKEAKEETLSNYAERILAQWEDDPEFQDVLAKILQERKVSAYMAKLSSTLKKIEQAGLELQELAKIKDTL